MIDKSEFLKKLEYYNVPFNYDKKYDFIYKNGDNILKILEILKENNLINVIIKFPKIIYERNTKEVLDIIYLLKNHRLLYLIKNCSFLLVRGRRIEMEKILEVLNKYNLSSVINDCPTVLAQGNHKEIIEIIKILENKKYLLEVCPIILARGKSQNIKKILELLKENNMENLLTTCPSILAYGIDNEIVKSIEILKKNNINLENVERIFLLTNSNNIQEIFDLTNNENHDIVFFNKVRVYLKLNGVYNKIYDIHGINNICTKLNINLDEFLTYMICNGSSSLVPYVKKTLNKQKYIWIGKSISLTKEQLNDNDTIILEILENVTSRFLHKYFLDKDELQSFILNIIINKCGNLFINYNDLFIQKSVIEKYCLKYCKKLLMKEKRININEIINNNLSENAEFLENYSFLEKDEIDLLNKISYYIESGYLNYFDLIKNDLNFTSEELDNKMVLIKSKIEQNKK